MASATRRVVDEGDCSSPGKGVSERETRLFADNALTIGNTARVLRVHCLGWDVIQQQLRDQVSLVAQHFKLCADMTEFESVIGAPTHA